MNTNETYYTIGTREQAAFECDGTDNWDEAVATYTREEV